MKKEFNTEQAGIWLATNRRTLEENSGNWVAVGIKENQFRILAKNKELDALVSGMGRKNLQDVLLARIPPQNQVCFF